ncbi:hypothetical protein ABKN59_005107 [Abortiporus biennis]
MSRLRRATKKFWKVWLYSTESTGTFTDLEPNERCSGVPAQKNRRRHDVDKLAWMLSNPRPHNTPSSILPGNYSPKKNDREVFIIERIAALEIKRCSTFGK